MHCKRPDALVFFVFFLCVLCMDCETARGAAEAGNLPYLKRHVNFLASTELCGRRIMSPGAIVARQYIARHFRSSGLRPWGEAKGLIQRVAFGKNVVGVIEGHDAKLSKEIVLVCAHYDHLAGKPGAADNAAGVAILLEMARQLPQAPLQNKRTICLAAFDGEETALWGALAFSRRPDFRGLRVAAIVNIDAVGRRAFDCMDDTFFLGHSHECGQLIERAAGLARNAGLSVHPCSLLLAGPSGDHAVFDALGIPSFFFTSGLYSDYHTKQDVPQRLDWHLILGVYQTTLDTVQALAGSSDFVGKPLTGVGSKEDLETIKAILSCRRENTRRAAKQEETDAIDACLTRLDKTIAAPSYTSNEACALIQDALLPLGHQLGDLLHLGRQGSRLNLSDWEWNRLLANLFFFQQHKTDLMEIDGKIADRLQAQQGSAFEFKSETYPLHQEEFLLETTEEGQRQFNLLLPQIYVSFKKAAGPLSYPRGRIRVGWSVYVCRGDTDNIIDYCLLRWRKVKWDKTQGSLWQKLLHEVAPNRPDSADYDEAVRFRCREKGYEDEAAWIQYLFKSRNPDLLRALFECCFDVYGSGLVPEFDAITRDVMFDSSMPPVVRALALSWHFEYSDKGFLFDANLLRDLSVLSNDTTPLPSSLNEPFPVSASLVMAPLFVRVCSGTDESDARPMTLGKLAQQRLDEIATGSALGESIVLMKQLKIFPNRMLFSTGQFAEGKSHCSICYLVLYLILFGQENEHRGFGEGVRLPGR